MLAFQPILLQKTIAAIQEDLEESITGIEKSGYAQRVTNPIEDLNGSHSCSGQW